MEFRFDNETKKRFIILSTISVDEEIEVFTTYKEESPLNKILLFYKGPKTSTTINLYYMHISGMARLELLRSLLINSKLNKVLADKKLILN